MFARVTRIKGDPSSVEKIASRVGDFLLPAVEGMTGFSGGLLLANRKNGEVMVVVLWREAQDVKASEGAAAEWRAGALKTILGVTSPETEVYEAAYLPPTPRPEPTVSISVRPGANMFARVTRLKGKADRSDIAIRRFVEGTIPVEEKLPGYRGGMLFIDRENGRMMAILIWLTEADLMASNEVGNLERAQVAALFGATEPSEVEYYEIQPLAAQVPG